LKRGRVLRKEARTVAVAKGRVRRRSAEEGDRFEEILRAAAELFYEKGYHATTMQDVADRVGMLKGSLYYYIDSKEDLLYITLDHVIKKGDDYFLQKVASARDPVEKLRRAIEAEIEYVIRDQVTVGLFLHEFDTLSDRRRRRILARMRRFQNRYIEIVREGQAAGVFRELDPRLVVYGILGMCNWVYRWYRPDLGFTIRQIASVFTRLILEGLVREGAPSASPSRGLGATGVGPSRVRSKK
jgi:AcrR family transcriptional regulator